MDWQDEEPVFYRDAGSSRRATLARILNASLPLFKAGGIGFRLHWSFPIVALIFAGWTASAGYGAPYHVLFAWGLTEAAILYTLVLLHELGHAAAGRMKGRPAKEIVLTPLGGQALIDRAMAGPSMEAEVTIAGPLVNLVLLALSMAILVPALDEFPSFWGDPFTARAVIGFAFWANVALAVFNLVPSFPMDGGRILRAFLAWRKGAERGTLIAARVGQVTGVFFVVLGIWRRGPFGILLAAIGVSNFIACMQTIRFVRAGAPVYEEYVGGVRPRTSETKGERAAREREEVERRVDELLAKVSREGLNSLTFSERRFLKSASRKYRQTGK